MVEKSKRLWAILLAVILALSIGLVACTPTVNGDPADKWAVTLDYNDEVVVNDAVVKPASRPRTYYVEKGKEMNEPAMPVRAGYQLAKWTTEKTGGDSVTFPFTPDSDKTIYAQWEAGKYQVTFDYNFIGAPGAYVETVEYNHAVDDPFTEHIMPNLDAGKNEGEYVHPDYAGYYTLGEWTLQPQAGAIAEYPYSVTKDGLHFYLFWYSNDTVQYKIGFDANYPKDDNDPKDKNDITDTFRATGGVTVFMANDLPKPTYNGYTFSGWSLTKDGDLIKYPWMPDSDATLYAKWEHTEYTVRYYLNYPNAPGTGGLYKTVKGFYGDKIKAEDVADPTRTFGVYNFTFDGWYDSAYSIIGQKVELPYTITKTVRLYAKWNAPKVVTDTFDAEFTLFNPNDVFNGWSGSSNGKGIIASDLPNAYSAEYPLFGGDNPDQKEHMGHHVSYLFTPGATLRYFIYSDKAVSGVTLKARMSTEFVPSLTISPDGAQGFQFIVNGTSLSYGSITVDGGVNAGNDVYKGSTFTEYTVSTNVSLKEGLNEIYLVTNNTTSFGGTTKASAPTVDYIKLETSEAELSWYPIYDNLWKFE